MANGQPRPPPRARGRIDLVAGILLGLVVGLAVVYLLVIVVGGGRDASDISTPSQTAPRGETTTGPAGRGAPAQP